MISIHEALDAVLAAVRPLPDEEVPLLQALGRAAAERIISPEQVPTFANSAMDGFAVVGAELEAGRREFRVVVDIPAGRYVSEPVAPGRRGAHHDRRAAAPGRRHRRAGRAHVRRRRRHDGRDRPRHRRERAPRGRGRHRRRRPLRARRPPRRRRDRPARRRRHRARARRAPAARRDPRHRQRARRGRPAARARADPQLQLLHRLRSGRSPPAPTRSCSASPATTSTRRGACWRAALENDVVITSGGVSVGDYDFVKQVQDELGVERRFWGVATKPGKPLAFGTRGDTLVFGVPGNPVAAMVSFEMYVRPALLALQGRPDVYRPWFFAASAEPVRRTKGRTEARRCRLTHEDGAIALHHHRPAGIGHPELDGGRGRAVLRAAGLPGRARPARSCWSCCSPAAPPERPPFPGGPTRADDAPAAGGAARERSAAPGGAQRSRLLQGRPHDEPVRRAVRRRAGGEHQAVAAVAQHADVGRVDRGRLRDLVAEPRVGRVQVDGVAPAQLVELVERAPRRWCGGRRRRRARRSPAAA